MGESPDNPVDMAHFYIHMTWLSTCHHWTTMHKQFAQSYTVTQNPASTLNFLLHKFLKQARGPNAHNLRCTQISTLPEQQRPIFIHRKSLCNQLGNIYLHKGQSGMGKRDWETVMPKQGRWGV